MELLDELNELCDINSIEYNIINDNIYIYGKHFEINDKLIYKVKTFIDIINGKNEMINMVCNKLNTTINNIKDNSIGQYDDEWNINYLCIKIRDNAIIVNIHNIYNEDLSNSKNTTYTSSDKKIVVKILIIFNEPLEYYLVEDKHSFKLNTVQTLENVLKQKFQLNQRQCDRNKHYKEDLCSNTVTIYKGFPSPYGSCDDESEFMMRTTMGYRCCSGCSSTYYFCSQECLDYSKKYNRCERCHENGKGTYVEELGYSLCNGRGDHNPPCIAKYRLEQRFKNDYEDNGFYEINKDIKSKLLDGCDELKEIIKSNGNRISINMLMDLYILNRDYAVRDRNEPLDIDIEDNNEENKENDEENDEDNDEEESSGIEKFKKTCNKILEEF